jgi:hypothetical protein
MPARDLDGTAYKVSRDGKRGKRLSDISEQQARTTFNELSKLYGDENALQMVKDFPLCLSLNKDLFSASLKEYKQIFGEEEAQAMICRNPGLLAVRPEEAARSTEQTMRASYLIAATRPIGPVALPTLTALLLVPTFEAITGIPIRATLFSSIF